MAELYSPELIVAQQEYLTALEGPGLRDSICRVPPAETCATKG